MKSFPCMFSQRWNHFLVCSASDEMLSVYAQPMMKFVPRMLSIFWMMFLKWVVISSYAENSWLSMRGNWLLVGLACAETGYSLAGHTQKLVTRWLSIQENSVLLVLNHVFPLSSVPLSPFPVPCLTSFVSCLKCLFLVSHRLLPFSRLCSLFPVHCSLSHVSVPCLTSSVPCLTSLFLVFHPLFHVSLLCSLSPVLSSQSYVSVPCLPFSFPNLKSLFLVSHSPF